MGGTDKPKGQPEGQPDRATAAVGGQSAGPESMAESMQSPEKGSPERGASKRGAGVIAAYLRTLPGSPGVYRMINGQGDALYVGKAKNLKKRVSAYTKPERQSIRIRRMIAETAAMEFVTTHTEAEALLLEANLIKRLKPRFNILLRDDKSFPSILVTTGHPFPQVLKHRGARKSKGEYFGPFASAGAVNHTLGVLQRAFYLRTCTDAVFSARTRPCLLYQIKRCAAPCVGLIGEDGYGALVDQARAFLRGDSRRIQQRLAIRMQQASEAQEYEKAAQYRDRIQALTRIQAHQDINLEGIGDADVIGAHQAGGHTCVQVFFFRGGANFGNRAYFPSHAREDEVAAILEAFVGQFYASRTPPHRVLVSQPLPDQQLVEDALNVHRNVHGKRRVRLLAPQRGEKRKLVNHAVANAAEALSRRLAESASQRRLLEGLGRALDLDGAPDRIEVYDNSHVSGDHAVGAMIVAGPDGMTKNAYRKFTIRGASPGDDYAMMREVLTRRFSRALKEDPDRTGGQWPDLILVDGGAGQLGVAVEVFAELGIDGVAVAGIAKGPERNAGRERIFLPGRDPMILGARDPVLYFLQRLRDEAHRFAIGAHRAKRSKAVTKSPLDAISGIGAKRKKALLHHFGSARAVGQSGLADLEAVEGISRSMANKIYDWFHPEG